MVAIGRPCFVPMGRTLPRDVSHGLGRAAITQTEGGTRLGSLGPRQTLAFGDTDSSRTASIETSGSNRCRRDTIEPCTISPNRDR
jgi:hypothetical protein